MKQISNKEYEKYLQYQTDKLHGRILTPKRQGTVLCLDCVFSAVGESEEQRA